MSVLPPMPPLAFDDALEALGLALVVRFGSRARGTAGPDSDLDLAVLRADGARLTHRELGALTLTLGARYGADADVVDLAVADALLRREVIRDGVVIHASSRSAWTELVTRTLIALDDLGPMLDACIEGVRRAARGAA
jgi:predicted nucleotidyltransferase